MKERKHKIQGINPSVHSTVINETLQESQTEVDQTRLMNHSSGLMNKSPFMVEEGLGKYFEMLGDIAKNFPWPVTVEELNQEFN